ncbi:unnamed protein product [Haemonchus placei]|uniref:Uncharacterized protein n=1 Tax=Haemonchus placei TaxID=6290 RepID=A0A0N4WX85_HAEPC|nr:unnamed protein product [Haemonchus placei]
MQSRVQVRTKRHWLNSNDAILPSSGDDLYDKLVELAIGTVSLTLVSRPNLSSSLSINVHAGIFSNNLFVASGERRKTVGGKLANTSKTITVMPNLM